MILRVESLNLKVERLHVKNRTIFHIPHIHSFRPQRRAFVACLDSIPKEYDVKSGAQCLVNAFDGKLENYYGEAALDSKLDFIDKQEIFPIGKLDVKKIKRFKVKKRLIKLEAQRKARKVCFNKKIYKKRMIFRK